MKRYCPLGTDFKFLWRRRFLLWFSCLWCIVEVVVALKTEVLGFPRTLVMHTRLFCVVAWKTTVMLVQSCDRSFVYSVCPLIYSFMSVFVIQYIWFLITWHHSTMVVFFISMHLVQGLLDRSIQRKGGSINYFPNILLTAVTVSSDSVVVITTTISSSSSSSSSAFLNSSLAGSKKSTCLTDQTLLIHCSAKNNYMAYVKYYCFLH